jgi:hypothetical protein
MARRKDGRPRSLPTLAREFNSHDRSWSHECNVGKHDECDTKGGCGGCYCHLEQD